VTAHSPELEGHRIRRRGQAARRRERRDCQLLGSGGQSQAGAGMSFESQAEPGPSFAAEDGAADLEQEIGVAA
jgi:hypothetical protein